MKDKININLITIKKEKYAKVNDLLYWLLTLEKNIECFNTPKEVFEQIYKSIDMLNDGE
ncbi:hypothetical protein M0Q50_09960 [bacterium]|jgi:hypothetical protein|nr:hypothetical protein [bacterium]